MNKTSKILLGFTTGALAGIVTGLLLAPDKRTEKDRRSKSRKEDSEEEKPLFFEKATMDFDCAEKHNKE